MPADLHSRYTLALRAAHSAVERGDIAQAMFSLRAALRIANACTDKRYRSAVFKALSLTRFVPASH